MSVLHQMNVLLVFGLVFVLGLIVLLVQLGSRTQSLREHVARLSLENGDLQRKLDRETEWRKCLQSRIATSLIEQDEADCLLGEIAYPEDQE